MAVQRSTGPGESGAPIPRDLPDQQAGEGEDPWDIGDSEQPDEASNEAPDVPDTDESGTGRQGAPHADSGQSDDPVPDEPSA
ncbi:MULTISPECIES: hypothetical protein [unclassified Streptomyces]|uniref:hypothetical protein n=1 Tax=unclassified Streptomyces TaxID=2593676 RepID=UPI00380ABDF6